MARKPARSTSPQAPIKKINLALQGGGAHGAFTWGVLDALLADPRIEIEAMSGTSAGAMNAVVTAEGLVEGGRDSARAQLEAFWRAVSDAAQLSPLSMTPVDAFLNTWNIDANPMLMWFDLLTRVASPYDLNPMNLNPLKDLLERFVNFELVRQSRDACRLHIAATHVETGRARVFTNAELTADHVMASACLPYIFQAIEIDGEAYWDGGYVGNPVLWPFFYESESCDVLLVQINPIERLGTPKSARDIMNRVNEISFNSSLQAELRSMEFVGRLIDEGRLKGTRYRKILMHRIAGEDALKPLGAATKLTASWDFLLSLRDKGRSAGLDWLDANWSDLGERSTINLRRMFAGDRM